MVKGIKPNMFTPTDKFISLMHFEFSDIKKIFKRTTEIAHILLNNYAIINNLSEKRWINTIEFYIANITLPDYASQGGATHERAEQKKSGYFYVHTKSKADWTTPIFNRHGIDITCGSNNCYGGILIREIENPKNIEGSGRTLRAILRGDEGYNPIPRKDPRNGWSEDEKEILEDLNNSSIFCNETNIKIIPIKNRNCSLYKGKRVGIGKTKFSELELRYSVRKINDSFTKVI